MRARTALLPSILATVAAFAAPDWTATATPTAIHLVLARAEAPLGVVLPLVTGGVTVFLTTIETSAMLEARRYAREPAAPRQLADAAEPSRFNRRERPAPPGTSE